MTEQEIKIIKACMQNSRGFKDIDDGDREFLDGVEMVLNVIEGNITFDSAVGTINAITYNNETTIKL